VVLGQSGGWPGLVAVELRCDGDRQLVGVDVLCTKCGQFHDARAAVEREHDEPTAVAGVDHLEGIGVFDDFLAVRTEVDRDAGGAVAVAADGRLFCGPHGSARK
jgi:hypothetical protein